MVQVKIGGAFPAGKAFMTIKPGRQQCLLKISWAAIGGEVHVGQSDRKGCADKLSGTCQEDSDGKIHGESEKPKASGGEPPFTKSTKNSVSDLGSQVISCSLREVWLWRG
jgi:hypothetical protein